MEYSKIIDVLQQASLFDLHRLRGAIDRLLEDPARLTAIRARLKIGQEISYFDPDQNRDIAARVIKLKRTRISVEHKADQTRWNIPLYYVNLDQVDTNLKLSSTDQVGINRNELKTGDRVGFRDDQNNDLYGKVIRLNPKTATIILDDNSKWRVSYALLYPVIDGEAMNASGIITGEIIDQHLD